LQSILGLFGIFRAMSLTIGQAAPEFKASDDTGKMISLAALRGRWVVLYFYPKDNTPGCSIEAGKFEQILPELNALGAEVIGVSTDSSASHANFREKCNLTFPLLADTDKSIGKVYGVIGGLMGMIGIAARQSFLIDPQGILAQHWKMVNPMTHALEVKQELEAKQKSRL
jgi:thioredoxin-dependent peroxiredoxin